MSEEKAKRRVPKWVKITAIVLAAIIVLCAALVGAAAIVWRHEISTLSGFKKLADRDHEHQDGAVYRMDVSGGFYFDDYLAQGGASSDAGSTGDAAALAENGVATDAATSESTADFSAVRENAKLILSADLTLETQDYDATCASLEQMTAEAGGYIQSSGNSGETGSRMANYTLRVPQEQFEKFFAQIGETCHVVSANRWSEEVGS